MPIKYNFNTNITTRDLLSKVHDIFAVMLVLRIYSTKDVYTLCGNVVNGIQSFICSYLYSSSAFIFIHLFLFLNI